MKIYEKIFARLEELHMSQTELSRRTGIATSTISDWRKKQINPQADKLVSICKALDMTLVELLCVEENEEQTATNDYVSEENYMIELFRQSDTQSRRRIISYLALFDACKQINDSNQSQQRNVSVVQDIDGNSIVVINDIRFKGKRSIDWKEVRAYLKEYVGDFYKVASTGDVIYIGSDLPSEYSGSVYTKRLNGAVAKAKANATQGIPEMIEISTGRYFRENNKGKHNWNARNGWYRYDTYFALPVYGDNEDIERYNVFHASLIIRHANDGKMYLYDILDIKKETTSMFCCSTPSAMRMIAPLPNCFSMLASAAFNAFLRSSPSLRSTGSLRVVLAAISVSLLQNVDVSEPANIYQISIKCRILIVFPDQDHFLHLLANMTH